MALKQPSQFYIPIVKLAYLILEHIVETWFNAYTVEDISVSFIVWDRVVLDKAHNM